MGVGWDRQKRRTGAGRTADPEAGKALLAPVQGWNGKAPALRKSREIKPKQVIPLEDMDYGAPCDMPCQGIAPEGNAQVNFLVSIERG